MSRRLVRSLGVWTTALAVVLIPNVALSDADADSPRTCRFFSAEGVPLSDDCYLAPAVPTFFVVHGFQDTGLSAPSLQQASAIQNFFPEANVIIVDWRPAGQSDPPRQAQEKAKTSSVLWAFFGICQEYLQEYRNTAAAGKSIGREIAEWIKRKGILPQQTVISGHSLDAQIAAFASDECARPEMCGEPVHAIIAADPAGPCFEQSPPEERLDKSDAHHVIVVHTTALLGDENPVGTLDIYVEWPENEQPNDVDRHSLARELITRAFLSEDTSTMGPTASEPVPSVTALLRNEILLSLLDNGSLRAATVSRSRESEHAWSEMRPDGQVIRVTFKLERPAEAQEGKGDSGQPQAVAMQP